MFSDWKLWVAEREEPETLLAKVWVVIYGALIYGGLQVFTLLPFTTGDYTSGIIFAFIVFYVSLLLHAASLDTPFPRFDRFAKIAAFPFYVALWLITLVFKVMF